MQSVAREPSESRLTDPRVRRFAFVPAALALITVMFSLDGVPEPIEPVTPSGTFDGRTAARDAREVARLAPSREPGSAGDEAAADFVREQFNAVPAGAIGEGTFEAEVDGETRSLRNVTLTLPGEAVGHHRRDRRPQLERDRRRLERGGDRRPHRARDRARGRAPEQLRARLDDGRSARDRRRDRRRPRPRRRQGGDRHQPARRGRPEPAVRDDRLARHDERADSSSAAPRSARSKPRARSARPGQSAVHPALAAGVPVRPRRRGGARQRRRAGGRRSARTASAR